MPTYDYECKDCGYEFEHFQRMSDEPLGTCPECGGALRRLIGGGTGIIFKGSGFYVTDNGKSKGSDKGEARANEGAAGENGGEKKAESTSEGSGTENKSETKASAEASNTSEKKVGV
jgi:putative FmdB family regulatory protein